MTEGVIEFVDCAIHGEIQRFGFMGHGHGLLPFRSCFDLAALVVCAGFAWLLHWGTGLPWVTLLLGTSPGGITEMAITAKVLQLGVPVVTAFQVCRLIAVLLLVAPMYRWLNKAAQP